MVKVSINGLSYEVPEDFTILQACRQIGIDIPTLCHDDRLEPHAACRLCIVEVEGMRNLSTSCSLKVADGMNIKTHSPKVVETRKEILDLLFSNHPNDCLTCDKSGECKLQNYCYEYGVIEGTYQGDKRSLPIDDSNHFYSYDPNKCILCGKCVRVCSELQCTNAITIDERGFNTSVATPFRQGLEKSTCVSCGNCVSVCPVGALVPKKKERFRYWETNSVRTTCSYCGVGCQMDLLVKDDKVVEVQPAMGPANKGMLCVKGKFAYNFVNHKDRLTSPLLKRDGKFVEIGWDEAYEIIVNKITEIKKNFGPDAIAALSSARCTNEENYLMQKLLRAVIGTNNVDHCARL